MDTLTLKQSYLDSERESVSFPQIPLTLDKTITQKDKKTKEDNTLITLKEALEALMKAQQEQEKALASTKTEQKTIEKKTDTKKDKDITVVVEDEHSKEKLKNKFTEGILSITRDMDGFEKFHLQQYQQQLANYARFLAEYLEGGRLALGKMQQSYTYTEEKKEIELPKTEVQMITYAETQDYARSAAMNAMLGKASANHVDPQTKEMWDLWRIFQHNQHMSFYYTSQWRGYGV
ncbi:MAG: hypothetical protein AABX98_02555 [Nanoarchaeota archaeon]